MSEEERNDLRAYLDQIVHPARDGGRTGLIVKHGNGLAISKLGPTVAGSSVIRAMSAARLEVEPTERW